MVQGPLRVTNTCTSILDAPGYEHKLHSGWATVAGNGTRFGLVLAGVGSAAVSFGELQR
jgi:hypothetical protein